MAVMLAARSVGAGCCFHVLALSVLSLPVLPPSSSFLVYQLCQQPSPPIPLQAMTGKLLGVCQELISSKERVGLAGPRPKANLAPEVVRNLVAGWEAAGMTF